MIRQAGPGDVAAIKAIIQHPKVWPWVGGELPEARKEFEPLFADKWVWLLGADDNAVFIIHPAPFSPVACIGHYAVHPRRWTQADKALKEAIAWVFDHTTYEKITGFTPANNRSAQRFAERAGFAVEGVIRKAYRVGNELMDVTVNGVSKHGH